MKTLSLRLFTAFIICISFGILFISIAKAIGNQSIEHFDTTIIGFVQGLESSWLTPIMKLFTWIGAGYIVALISIIAFLLLFFKYKYRQHAFMLVTVILGTVIFNALLKLYFKRERPEIHRILDAGGYSFPSGHTMMAFSLYIIIAYIAWRRIKTGFNRFVLVVFSAGMIVMISVSRIYLGVHYPSDITGGFAASIIWLTFVITVYELFINPRKKKSAPSVGS